MESDSRNLKNIRLTKSKRNRKHLCFRYSVAMRMFWYSNMATVNVYKVSLHYQNIAFKLLSYLKIKNSKFILVLWHPGVQN